MKRGLPSSFCGFIVYNQAALNAPQVLLRQRQAAPGISAACFCLKNFCLPQFLINCQSFGKERSKLIKVEEKFTVIFKEVKQDCLLQQKLFELKKPVSFVCKIMF